VEGALKRILEIFLVGAMLCGCSGEDKNSATPMIRIAKKARQSGNLEASISFYNRAIAINPDDSTAYLGLAETYIDLKLLDAAIENIKKAESMECDKSRSSYLMGKIYLLSGDNQKAEKEFLKSDAIDSANALGAILDSRGEHQRAQRLYRQVIAKDPSYIDAYNNMGLSLMLCDNYKDAIFYLENACSLAEANITYRSNLALAYGLAGDMAKARSVYAQDFEGDALEEKIAYLEDIIAAKQQ
jgi:Flp pilus assembly protein TadD